MDAWQRVLPEGVLCTEGPCADAPADFDDGYVLPAHTVKPLQLLHTHPNDSRLVFYETPHVYTFDGVPTTASVTALAHEYEKPFVARDAIELMKTSRTQAWHRLEYVHDATPGVAGWTPGRGVLLVRGGKTVASLPPHALDAAADVRAVLRATAVPKAAPEGDDDELFTFARGMTDDEIAAAWRANGARASHMGTDRHHLAECFFNGLPCRWWEPDMQVLLDFCRDVLVPRGVVAHNTEKEIVCPDADLAGSLDLVAWDAARGVHHIVDFKRSEKLRSQMRGYDKMRPPFEHLDDCKGAGYALQTSIYQYVLEREYGMVIGDRILLSLHAGAPFATSVPYLKAEVEFIMQRRFALTRARRAVAATRPDMRCARTGAPLVDAVVLADGTKVMEKVALVHGLTYDVDAETRTAFDALVAAREDAVVLDKDACKSWKRQMPAGGIPPLC